MPIKNSFKFILFFLISLPGPLWAKVITLEAAFNSAIEKTESLRLVRSKIQEADAIYQQNRGAFFPDLSAQAFYQKQNTTIGSSNDTQASGAKLLLSQSLIAGGRDHANLQVAKLNREAQEFNYQTVKDGLFSAVAHSFYAVLAAAQEVENTQKSVDLIKKRITELNKRIKIGNSRNIDVLAASAQLSILEAQILEAQSQQEIEINNLCNITGLERDVQLKDELKMPTEIKPLAELISRLDLRPDILGLKTSLQASASVITAAKSGNYPSLDLNADYYLNRTPASQTGPDWDAMVTLKIPLYEGGITQATVRIAEEKENQAQLLIQQKRRDAETSLRTIYQTLTSSTAQIQSLEKAVSSTKQNYLEQEKNYRLSLATNLDVLQAFNTYLDTQRTLDKKRFQVLSAFAELKAVTNEITF